jgi:hypothetical protein
MRREKTQIRNAKGKIITSTTEIQEIIRECFGSNRYRQGLPQ